jgi:hypothetical protein
MTPGQTANASLEKVRANSQERARVPGLTVEGLPRSPARPLLVIQAYSVIPRMADGESRFGG